MTAPGGIITAAVKHLMAAGVEGDDLLAALADMEAAIDTRSVGAKRQARYRQRKAERNESSQSVTVTHPPYEDTSTPRGSEAKASGASADPIKDLFDAGVALLTSSGQTEKQARSLIGKWRKSRSDGEVMTGLIECRARAISEPVEWLEKRFNGAKCVSESGYEYRGDKQAILREAERRADWTTYWRIKGEASSAPP